MVDFRVGDVAQAMDLGREAAEHVSATFAKPIKLEFEKVYNPYLLISKKRYAGLLWTVPEKWDKMDTKGIETVRRDNCALVRRVVGTCLDKLLIDRDVPGAAAYVKSTISDLLMNRLDLSLLVITKALSKTEYDVSSRGSFFFGFFFFGFLFFGVGRTTGGTGENKTHSFILFLSFSNPALPR